MLGDKLIIKEEHIKAAKELLKLLLPKIKAAEKNDRAFIITIAGESGAGKSETAVALSQQLVETGIKSHILQQDDYFFYPPKTNDMMRRKDINHVGTSEVNLDLLDQNLRDIQERKEKIEKPLVAYEQDEAVREILNLRGIPVIIVEGTYTTLLKNAHQRVFIDRIYLETKSERLERGREEQDEYLEKVLEIEHGIISEHKAKADIIVTHDFDVIQNENK